tara:strand:- start:86 stop:409 length:324 start_codon:yes stop_codon:yes gene_type:complete
MLSVFWLILGILVVGSFILLKLLHVKHRVTLGLVIFIGLFVYFTLSAVVTSNSLELNTTDGIFGAMKVYTGWLGNGYQNVKVLTGNAIGMDWASVNGTILNKSILDR